MTTAERELDQNTNFDWNRIQESGQEVEPVFGPGYTGLVNLGNRYQCSVDCLVNLCISIFCWLTNMFVLAAATWRRQCKLYFQRICFVKGPCNIYMVLLQ